MLASRRNYEQVVLTPHISLGCGALSNVARSLIKSCILSTECTPYLPLPRRSLLLVHSPKSTHRKVRKQNQMTSSHYDFIVVGGRSSSIGFTLCITAWRKTDFRFTLQVVQLAVLLHRVSHTQRRSPASCYSKPEGQTRTAILELTAKDGSPL